MKVLYSCLSLSWGGMEMYTITSLRELINKEISVDLICYPDSKIFHEAKALGIPIINYSAKGYFNPIETIKLSGKIRSGNYNLIHTHASKDLWHLVPALKLANSHIPLFLTKHVGSFISKKDFLHRILYKRVTTVFAISTIIKNNLLETTPLPKDKVKILFDGVDTEIFSPQNAKGEKVREEFGIDNSNIVIGMMARFTWGKGHEEFLFAAKKLTSKYKNLIFLLVGEASRGEKDYFNKIESLVKKYKLERYVIFTGFRKDTVDVLDAMDIFAFPSHSEAFGIALVEAMSMAKPTVSSNANGILDIVIDEKTGLLFQNKNGDDFAEKLEILINSPEKRNALGKNARARAIKHFDLKFLIDQLIKIYQKYKY